jgi:rod shape-determining protein MreD
VVTVLLLGAVALWITGAAAGWLPRGLLPDPALLIAIALGLHLPATRGLVAAWCIGWQADLLSGGPLGLFAFCDLLAWTATRLGERQLALARPVALIPFAAALTIAQVVLVAFLEAGPRLDDPGTLPVLVLHALANAAAVPFVSRAIGAVVGSIDTPEAPRGGLRFDAGAPIR